jgi:hypothetical protein
MPPMLRSALVLAFPALLVSAACSGEATGLIGRRWSYQTPAPAAPPGIGPERRVVVGTSGGDPAWVTLTEETGTVIEGPHRGVLGTMHAPIAFGDRIFLISMIGKLIAYNFGGTELFSVPPAPLGITTAPRASPRGEIVVGTTNGRLIAFDASSGAVAFDATVGGALTSPPVFGPDGVAFVTTDNGRLVGVDPAEGVVFDVALEAPASGASVDPERGRIAAGELDGVRVFERDRRERFRHARGARVTGTRFVSGGVLLVWGEDGVVERLDPEGAVLASYRAGPPIYADVIPLAGGGFAVFDAAGGVHKVGPSGNLEAKLELERAPATQVIQGDTGFVFIAVGDTIRALDFALR